MIELFHMIMDRSKEGIDFGKEDRQKQREVFF